MNDWWNTRTYGTSIGEESMGRHLTLLQDRIDAVFVAQRVIELVGDVKYILA